MGGAWRAAWIHWTLDHSEPALAAFHGGWRDGWPPGSGSLDNRGRQLVSAFGGGHLTGVLHRYALGNICSCIAPQSYSKHPFDLCAGFEAYPCEHNRGETSSITCINCSKGDTCFFQPKSTADCAGIETHTATRIAGSENTRNLGPTGCKAFPFRFNATSIAGSSIACVSRLQEALRSSFARLALLPEMRFVLLIT
jgi:hypothetical protein